MKKFRFQWIHMVIGIFFVGALTIFQNCTQTKFTSIATSSSGPFEQRNNPIDPNPAGIAPPQTVRFKTITPTNSETANPGKVKALLVIDNSGSMGGSQQNLSATINPLLSELEKYNADVRIVSTTFGSNECASATDSKCRESALYLYADQYNTIVNPDSTQTQSEMRRYSMNSSVDFKYVAGTNQSDKVAVSRNITTKINDFGTKGSDNESPFAAILVNTIDFDYFKSNDKALIFVVSDEDDSGSITKLLSSKSYDMRRTLTTTKSQGIAIRTSGFAYSGYCNGSGENNSGGGPRIGGIVSQTLAGCQEFLANMNNQGCSYSCGFRTDDQPSNGEGFPLNGRTFAEACASYSTSLPASQKFESCISRQASTIAISNEVINQSLHLGLDETAHAAVSLMPDDQKKNFFVRKLKERLSARVGEKYLIQVATNIANQSCGLNGEFQSNDRFFQSIANQFPIQNFKVTSICSQDGTSAESIRKLASDFISVVNSEYALGLLPTERVVSVKLKLKNNLEPVDLKQDVQYKIRNGQFVLLDPNLIQFDKIDIEIKSN